MPFGSSQWMYSSGGFYPHELEQSLRFNDDDSAYLSFTPSTDGTSLDTQTFSFWIKRANIGSTQFIIGGQVGGSFSSEIGFNSNDTFSFYTGEGRNITTNQVFRDPSAWYHIVAVYDSTQATESNRLKLYVNGEEITSFSNATYPTQNTDSEIMKGGVPTRIGAKNTPANHLDGYLAEVNFIDGQALDPTDFGEFKSGVWVAKSYTGTYGTNGFHLTFADSGNIGDDLSGNGNDWTANNLAATDVMLDVPENNFATWNPLVAEGNANTFSEGNLKLVTNTGSDTSALGSLAVSSGKYYFEILCGTGTTTDKHGIGISDPSGFDPSTENFFDTSGGFMYFSSAEKYNNGSGVSYGSTYTDGDIIGVAFDLDAGTLEFFKNNVSQGTAFTGLSGEFAPAYCDTSGSASETIFANFGQDSSFAGNKTAQGNTDANGVGDFYYAPPSGYLALCTANLPDPVIDPNKDDVPEDYFNTVLYTGDGTTGRGITGVGFQPDWVWIKERSVVRFHRVFDVVRGATKKLFTNETDAELTDTSELTSFDSDGFTVGNNAGVNQNNETFVAWNWLAGNSTSSNTDGSITSTVSVNQDAGFSIVGYTGNGTAGATVGHGLGAVPSMVIVKERGNANGWYVYHQALSANNTVYLDVTNGSAPVAIWNNTTPTSSVISYSGGAEVNRSGGTYINYVFAEVEGYSKFGSYTGNGSTDGPFVYCGFRPAWVLVKRTDRTGSWYILDVDRSPFNVTDDNLIANSPNSEDVDQSLTAIDITSNGFKIRNSFGNFNASGGSYIFMAFAEMPFKYSNAR